MKRKKTNRFSKMEIDKFDFICLITILFCFYFGIAFFRFSFRNDCLTKMQLLKKTNKIIVWDSEEFCKNNK